MLLCLICAFVAYHGIFGAEFIGLDDAIQHQTVQQGISREGLRWAFTTTHAARWQPIVWISYMLDTTLQGFHPTSFHRTNVLLHLINIILVFVLAQKITRNGIAAAIATMLFAIHPAHVESVVFIAERQGLLGMAFGCASLIAYLEYGVSNKQRYYIAACFGLALALMSNSAWLPLPLLFLLLDAWPLDRLKANAKVSALQGELLTEKLPFFILVVGINGVSGYVQYRSSAFLGLDTLSLWGRIANAAISFWRYLWHIIYPLRLAVFYPHPIRWPIWLSLPAVFGLAACCYIGIRKWQQFPRIGWAFAWFTLTLLPVLGFTQTGWHAMADRFLYLPAVGLYIVTGLGVATIFHRFRAPVIVAGSLLVVSMLVLSQRQTAYWQNSIALFSRAISVTNNNWVMHNSLGAAFSHAGQFSEASHHFEEAVNINPDNATAWFNLGHVRFVQERWDEAAKHFERSLALAPNYRARFNLAVTYTRRGALREAQETYLYLLESNPHHIPSLLNLGRLYRDQEKYAQALACYRLVKKADPQNPQARTGIAIAMLATADDPMPAISVLIALIEEDAGNTEAREALQGVIHGEASQR